MSNRFEAEGNLGKSPELRSVRVGGEDRDVLDFSIHVERRVPDGNGGFADKGSFWLNGSMWGRRARVSHEYLKKGMRVRVVGELMLETWEKDGEQRAELKLNADSITIDPITYAPRKEK